MSDSTDDDPTCLHCGEPIPEGVDHRIVPAVEDGTAVHRRFCDEACLEAWTS